MIFGPTLKSALQQNLSISFIFGTYKLLKGQTAFPRGFLFLPNASFGMYLNKLNTATIWSKEALI